MESVMVRRVCVCWREKQEREREGREGWRHSIELVGQAAVGETRRTTTMIVRHVKSLFHDDCPRR